MSKSLRTLNQIYLEQAPPTPRNSNKMEFEQIMSPRLSQKSHESEDEIKETKKPSKITRKQRVTKFIKRVNDDSMEKIMEDILNENARLRRELESMRVANTSLKREYEEMMHSIFQDRLKNQGNDLNF